MPKSKLFCFECRTTKREIRIACTDWELSNPTPTCQHCGNDMILANNWPTPRRIDDKGWRKLERKVRQIAFRVENRERHRNMIYLADPRTQAYLLEKNKRYE